MRIQAIINAADLTGAVIRRKDWQWSPALPDALILVPGRQINASFGPMKELLGEGRPFETAPHFDAIRRLDEPLPLCVVGYTFSQEDLMANDWEIIPMTGGA